MFQAPNGPTGPASGVVVSRDDPCGEELLGARRSRAPAPPPHQLAGIAPLLAGDSPRPIPEGPALPLGEFGSESYGS